MLDLALAIRDDLVDLVGIEPTTTCMPWKLQSGILLTTKGLKTRAVGKNGLATNLLPNNHPNGANPPRSALYGENCGMPNLKTRRRGRSVPKYSPIPVCRAAMPVGDAPLAADASVQLCALLANEVNHEDLYE
jgi:hypothetical protein